MKSESYLISLRNYDLKEHENEDIDKFIVHILNYSDMTSVSDHSIVENILTLSQTTILDSSKLKEFADDNLKSEENGRKFFKQFENTVGKGEIARYEQFLLFPQRFQKPCTAHT